MSRARTRDGSLLLRQAKGASNIPPAPIDSQALKLFARSRAGRMMAHMIGPAGIDVALQPGLFGNTVCFFTPQGAATIPIGFGSTTTTTVAGTGAAASHPALATTNDYTVMSRTEFGSGTTATGTAGFRSTLAPFTRGNAAGRGGFFFHSRFGLSAFSGTWQILIGLSALAATLGGEPSVQNHTAALVKDSGDANFQFCTRDGTTTNKSNTGVAPALNTPYDFVMFCPPNNSNVTMRLVNGITGALLAGDTIMSANLPGNTTFLSVHFQLRSASGTTSKSLGMNRVYCEADY